MFYRKRHLLRGHEGSDHAGDQQQRVPDPPAAHASGSAVQAVRRVPVRGRQGGPGRVQRGRRGPVGVLQGRQLVHGGGAGVLGHRLRPRRDTGGVREREEVHRLDYIADWQTDRRILETAIRCWDFIVCFEENRLAFKGNVF